jgi:hypothetical protein
MKKVSPLDLIGKTVLGFYYDDSDSYFFIVCDHGIGYQFYPKVEGYESNWKGFNSFSVEGLKNLLYSEIIGINGYDSNDQNGHWSVDSSLFIKTDKGTCTIRYNDNNYCAWGDECEYMVTLYHSCCRFKLSKADWLQDDWEKFDDFEN